MSPRALPVHLQQVEGLTRQTDVELFAYAGPAESKREAKRPSRANARYSKDGDKA